MTMIKSIEQVQISYIETENEINSKEVKERETLKTVVLTKEEFKTILPDLLEYLENN